MNCINCGSELPGNSRFCKYCGASQLELYETISTKKSVLTLLSIFYGIDLMLCLLITFGEGFKQLKYYILFDVLSIANALLFTVIIFKDLKSVLAWKNFSLPRLLFYTSAAIVFSVVVQVFVKWINKNFFEEEYYYYYAFIGTGFPKLYMVLMIAILPALFEELAYRGVVTTALKKIFDGRQALFITAFVFAIIHLNFLSLVWLIPFAIFLGYIREKEQTIWYGVFVHFGFNLIACLYEFFDLKLF